MLLNKLENPKSTKYVFKFAFSRFLLSCEQKSRIFEHIFAKFLSLNCRDFLISFGLDGIITRQ